MMAFLAAPAEVLVCKGKAAAVLSIPQVSCGSAGTARNCIPFANVLHKTCPLNVSTVALSLSGSSCVDLQHMSKSALDDLVT